MPQSTSRSILDSKRKSVGGQRTVPALVVASCCRRGVRGRPAVPQLSVGRLAEGKRPEIDGRVDEAVWSIAEPFTPHPAEPDEGHPLPSAPRSGSSSIAALSTFRLSASTRHPTRLSSARAAGMPTSPKPIRSRSSSTRSTTGRTHSSSGPIHSGSSTTAR